MFSIWLLFCAILASWSIQVQAALFRHSPAPHRIHQPMYNRIHRYTAFASAAYIRHCPNPPFDSKVLKYIDIERTDTQAVLYRDDYKKRLILAFPGTRGVNDSRRNDDSRLVPYKTFAVGRKNCPRCRAHRGWLGAWNAISKEAISALRHARKKHPKYRIVLAGHSMGGALASLAFGSLKSGNFDISGAYSFGQPRTGNQEYANFIDKLAGVRNGSEGHFHRVTHANDGVPQVPGHVPGRYTHHSTEYWEQNDKHGSQDRKFTFRCFGQEPTNCNEATNAKGIIDNAHGYYSGYNMGNISICHDNKKHGPS